MACYAETEKCKYLKNMRQTEPKMTIVRCS